MTALVALSVVFFNIGEPAPFWDVFTAASQAAAHDLQIDLEVLNAHGDHLKMIEQAQAVAARAQKPDYALVNNEKGAGGRMLEALAAAGIRTFLVSNVFEPAELKKYGHPREKIPQFLGMLEPDHEGAGQTMGRLLIEAGRAKFPAERPLRLLAISGEKVTEAAFKRDAGLKRALAAAPDVQLEQLVHSAWQRDKARRQLLGLLRRWPRTRLIWAANDPMALGAIDALRESGRAPGRDALIVGLNLSTEALQEVRAGEMLATVGGHFLGGAFALVLLRDYHDGFDFAPEGTEQKLPMGAVDAAHVDEYLSRMSDQSWSRVDFRRFSRSFNPKLQKHEFTLEQVLRR